MRAMRKCEISSPEQCPSSMLQMWSVNYFSFTSGIPGTTCIEQNIHTCIMLSTFLQDFDTALYFGDSSNTK